MMLGSLFFVLKYSSLYNVLLRDVGWLEIAGGPHIENGGTQAFPRMSYRC